MFQVFGCIFYISICLGSFWWQCKSDCLWWLRVSLLKKYNMNHKHGAVWDTPCGGSMTSSNYTYQQIWAPLQCLTLVGMSNHSRNLGISNGAKLLAILQSKCFGRLGNWFLLPLLLKILSSDVCFAIFVGLPFTGVLLAQERQGGFFDDFLQQWLSHLHCQDLMYMSKFKDCCKFQDRYPIDHARKLDPHAFCPQPNHPLRSIYNITTSRNIYIPPPHTIQSVTSTMFGQFNELQHTPQHHPLRSIHHDHVCKFKDRLQHRLWGRLRTVKTSAPPHTTPSLRSIQHVCRCKERSTHNTHAQYPQCVQVQGINMKKAKNSRNYLRKTCEQFGKKVKQQTKESKTRCGWLRTSTTKKEEASGGGTTAGDTVCWILKIRSVAVGSTQWSTNWFNLNTLSMEEKEEEGRPVRQAVEQLREKPRWILIIQTKRVGIADISLQCPRPAQKKVHRSPPPWKRQHAMFVMLVLAAPFYMKDLGPSHLGHAVGMTHAGTFAARVPMKFLNMCGTFAAPV